MHYLDMWYVEHITRSNIFKAANCKFLYFYIAGSGVRAEHRFGPANLCCLIQASVSLSACLSKKKLSAAQHTISLAI
jgi:hypothetical protein